MVGTSGQAGMRFAPATASGRTLPPSTRGLAAEKNVNVPCTAPVTTAPAASPDPRYGTSMILVPAVWFSCVIEIAGDVAGPEVPKLILLGLALASSINSFSDLYGRPALTISTSGGPSEILPISVKSSTAL